MNRLRCFAAFSVAAGLAVLPPVSSNAAEPSIVDRPLRLQIADQTFGVADGDALTATFELVGSEDDLDRLAATVTPTPPPTTTFEATTIDAATDTVEAATAGAATVVVTAHQRVVAADQLARLDDEGPTSTTDSIELSGADILASVDGRLIGEIAVPVRIAEPGDADRNGLNVGQPGIYPVTIDVRVDGEVVASSVTFIELVDPEADVGSPLAVSIMAGVRDPGPWPSPTELTGASIEVATLIELAEAVEGPLSIALPPVLVSELTVPANADGSTAATEPNSTSPPSSDVPISVGEPPSSPGATEPAFQGIESPDALLDAFRADELLAVPAFTLDPSSLVAINQIPLFTGQLRAGEDVLSIASPRAVVSRAVWSTDHSISGDAVVMLRNLGIRMVVVPNDVANGLGVPTGAPIAAVFGVRLGDGGTLPAMTFSPLGHMLQAPLPSDDAPTPNASAVRLLVELQLARATADVPAVLLATPRVTVPDPAITAQFVALADDLPDVAVVPVSRLPGIVDGGLVGGAPPVTLPATAGVGLAARLARVDVAREDARHMATMLVDSNRGSLWTAAFDRAMSSAVDDTTAFQHLAETESEIAAVRRAIVPPAPFTFTITGTQSTLRLQVRNTGTEPLTVRIRVRSSKIISEQPADQVVPASGSARFDVPVEARSNGTFTIEVDVLTPDNERLADPVVLKAKVTRVTGLSQVVTGGAALVLASWWFSHLRRRRRRRLAAAGMAPTSVSSLVDSVSPDAAEAQAPPPETADGADGTSDPTGEDR